MPIVKSRPHPFDGSSKSVSQITLPGAPLVWTYTTSVGNVSDVVTYPDPVMGRDYRQLIRQRRCATTPLSGTKYAEHTNGLWGYSYDGKNPSTGEILTKRFDGHYYTGAPVVQAIPASKLNQAREQYLLKCKSVQRPFMTGVALGEIRDTIRLIRHPLSTLYKDQLRFSERVKRLSQRRLIFRTSREANAATEKVRLKKTRQLSDLYLEATFGWRPLYNDIISGCEALSRLSYVPPTQRVNRVFRDEWTSSNPTSGNIVGVTFTGTDDSFYSYSIAHRGAVKIQTGLSQGFGFDYRTLGFLETIPTVWELIPYSFLIDYFVNVGSILDASTFLTCDLAWAQETTRKVTKRVATPTWNNFTSGAFPGTFRSYAKYRHTSVVDFTRVVYTGAWIPSLRFRVPENPLRWLNMVALATSFGSSSGQRGGRT